jgi:hypothetical protein
MAISEKELLEAGFSNREVDNLQGGFQQAEAPCSIFIAALSRRFRVSVWITVALVLVMLVTLMPAAGHISFLGHEFPCCPDHCLVDLSTCLGWKAFRLQKNARGRFQQSDSP